MRLVIVTALLAVTGPAWATEIVGVASTVDGDTLEIHGQRIRLYGIDAPEHDQICSDGAAKKYRCGQKASFALDDMIRGGKTVHCDQRDTDRYGRSVAVCGVNGKDINAAMVDQGWAVAYRKYSLDYVPNEERAKATKAGMWAGSFEMPWKYRHPSEASANAVAIPATANGVTCGPPLPLPTPDCQIKGNINSKGEHIYHMPGSSSYGATVITPSKGERYFCTPEEAEACGWRAPRG